VSAPFALAGRLEVFSLFEMLQFLESGHKAGTLTVRAADGEIAACSVANGSILSAELGHLRENEAVIAMAGWRSGRFIFTISEQADALPVSVTGQRHSITAILMETARLEDELERNARYFPGADTPLRLEEGAELDSDPYESGAPLVFSAIRSRPDVTSAELERVVPLSPLKVRLAVSALSSLGLLETDSGLQSVVLGAITPEGEWYMRLLRRFRGGIRVIVATCPNTTPRDIQIAVGRLAQVLAAPPPSMPAGGDGPSFVRLRPSAGGIVSLTFLPLRKKHRFLFPTFARSVELTLISEAAPPDEVRAWIAAAPEGVPQRMLGKAEHDLRLVEELAAFSREMT